MCRVPIDPDPDSVPDPDPKRPKMNHRGTETHGAAQRHRGIAVDRHRVFEVAVFRTIDGGDRGDLTQAPVPPWSRLRMCAAPQAVSRMPNSQAGSPRPCGTITRSSSSRWAVKRWLELSARERLPGRSDSVTFSCSASICSWMLAHSSPLTPAGGASAAAKDGNNRMLMNASRANHDRISDANERVSDRCIVPAPGRFSRNDRRCLNLRIHRPPKEASMNTHTDPGL